MLLTVGLAIFFSLFILSFNQGIPPDQVKLFDFIPAIVIELVGIAIFGIVGLVLLLGIVKMVRSIYRAGGLPFARGPTE